ncbi:MAG: Nif3-like dinuclear metal center hexameric protein [Clostridiales bacterium]
MKNIINELENIAPICLAEKWDNVGLIIGDENFKINRVLCALDVTKEVLEKAISEKAELIMSHHPFIFRDIKNINMNDKLGELIISAVKNDINIYSAHTNLDFSDDGLNSFLLKKIGVKKISNLLDYKTENLYKIVVFVPENSLDKVREAMAKCGAGFIGNYSHSSFYSQGTGTFLPMEGTDPYIGKKGVLERTDEIKLETIVKKSDLDKIIDVMIKKHPYEEVAYDIYKLENKNKAFGYGKIGILDKEICIEKFLENLKYILNLDKIVIIKGKNKNIKKIGVFTGALDQKIIKKLNNKVDILVTGDVKYHMAMDIKKIGLNVIDAGHFNTEIIAIELFENIIKEKFKNIEIIKNDIEKNPFEFIE